MGGTLINLTCNELNKKLTVDEQGNISIVDVGPVVPSNEIWYTSSDGNIVTPYLTSALPEINTNTYNDGKGIIKFKTDVTNIGDDAFFYCFTLTSITIPTSVTSIGSGAFRYGEYGYYEGSLKTITVGKNVFTYDGESRYFEITLSNGNVIDLIMWSRGG